MSYGWTDSTIFSRTVSALRSEDGRDFERAALPLVRIMWPNAVAMRGMNAIDQKGIDIAEFSADEFSVVIQCKGFQVIHLGEDQIAQCIRSIDSFLASDARADTEFWRDRLADFRTSLGKPAASGTKRVQNIRTVELRPWEPEQIAALATRFAGRTTDADARARLERFAQDAGVDAIRLFGDVPRTPLFLRLILETLESGDVLTWSRSAVLEQWARIKIERDVRAPHVWGGPGRRHLVSADESVDTVVERSFIVMEEAARIMVEVVDGAVELTPSCSLEALRTTAPRLVDILAEPTPLFLQSLLLPAPPSPSGERRIQFTHRVFQEFFLARRTTRPGHLIHGELPPAVIALREQLEGRSIPRVP